MGVVGDNVANVNTPGSNANVRMGDEMVSMIQHQRAFTVSSRVIATADEMLSELMQLER